MQSYSANITVSGSGYFGTLCAGGHVRVESVHHSLGQAPGVALISVPDLRPHQVVNSGDLALNNVYISAFGIQIFSGKIWEVKFAETADSSQVDIIAYDGRVTLGINAIGDPRATEQWNAIGWNVIFNKDNKPNKYEGEIVYGHPSASYWSINDIIEYIGDKYIDNNDFSTLGWSNNAFSAADAADTIPGEVDLTGSTISSALDKMVSMLGSASWSVNYINNTIYMVSTETGGTARTIYYATNNSTPTWGTSNDWSVSLDAKRGKNRFYAISGNIESEYTFSVGNGRLKLDTTWESGIYVAKFIVNPAMTNPSPYGIEWVPTLVSRRNVTGTGYLTSAQYTAMPGAGSEVMDRECLWVKDEDAWRRLLAGYDITYDPPAIYLEQTILVADDDGREYEITLSDPSAYDLAITVSVRRNWNMAGSASSSDGWSGMSIGLAEYSEHRDLRPKARLASVLPDLSQDDPTAMVTNGLEYYYNPQTDLNQIASASLQSFRLVHRELVASLPIPQHIAIGDTITFLPTGGGTSALGSTVICTCVDHYFNIEQKTVIRGENQLGTAQKGMLPLSARDIGHWRYEARIRQIAKQEESNRKLAEQQRKETERLLQEQWRQVRTDWASAGKEGGRDPISPEEYAATYERYKDQWVTNPPSWVIPAKGDDEEDE